MKAFVHLFCFTVVTILVILTGVYSLPHKRSTVPRQEALQFLKRSFDEENRDEEHENVELNEPAPPAPEVHPCLNTKVNKTVTTVEGKKILCLVPSEADLLKILKESGGFNKHYVAVTAKEAGGNFENPFNPLTQPQNHRWLNSTGRRRRSIDNEDEFGNVEVVSGKDRPKRSQISGLRSCLEQGKRNPQGYYQLCKECWWVTLLPDNKFPRYINERICSEDGTNPDPAPDFCNSYRGECVQSWLTQDLLTRTDRYEEVASPDPAQYNTVYKQVWETYRQKIRSCCRCQNIEQDF